LFQDLLASDAAACGTRRRGGGDSHVPGSLERPLLARRPVAGGVAAHDSARARVLPAGLYDTLARPDGRQRRRDPADPDSLRPLPAVLRRRRRSLGSEGMKLRTALGVAA